MSENKPRVKMIGEDGNAFNILGKVNKALKKAGKQESRKTARDFWKKRCKVITITC